MKKFVLLLMAFVVLCTALPIFSASNSEPDYYDISMMLNNTKNLSDIQISLISSKATNLTSQQRNMLFESHKQSATMPFVLNFIIGAGVGSFVQGDITGGTIGLVGDLVSMGVLLTGYAQMYTAILDGDYATTEGSLLMTVGGALTLASRIYQWIRPFKFAKEENMKLAKSLDVNFAMIPAIDNNGDFHMRIATGFSF